MISTFSTPSISTCSSSGVARQAAWNLYSSLRCTPEATRGTLLTGARISEGKPPHSRGRAAPETFAVVIPARDEATIIADAVLRVQQLSGADEIIVVDGESTDGTGEIARAAGARVLRSAPGRGLQMNVGARAARTDTLVFLHADCRLPQDAFSAMRQVFAAGHAAGLFAIDYASPHPLLRLLSHLSRWRSPWTEFGEAGLFLRRRLFEQIGGFPEWPLFEDLEMLARVRRRGSLGRARGCIQASPRRYLQRGVWRQQGLNIGLYVLFRVGVSPATLARLYDGRKHPAVGVLRNP